MRSFLLIAALCLVSLGVSAEIKFQSLDNYGATNIVIVDNNSSGKAAITDAVFINDGCEYPVKKIKYEIARNITTYKLVFKRFTLFKDCKLLLTVNGKKIVLNIQKSLTGR